MPGSDNHNWYALSVKSRHEFVTDGELKKKGIESYLPFVRKTRQWSDRKKIIDFPLFPGYLFTHLVPSAENFLSVLKTRGVVRFLSLEQGQPASVPAEEIDSLRILLDSGKPVDIYPHLKEGMRVRIKRGTLKGAEGILQKKEDQFIFLVNIVLLGKSVGAKVYADDVAQA